jgi:hypothetical protein
MINTTVMEYTNSNVQIAARNMWARLGGYSKQDLKNTGETSTHVAQNPSMPNTCKNINMLCT